MDGSAILGLVVLSVVILMGLVISRALARLALPARQRLYEQGADLMRRRDLTSVERGYISYCMDNAFSFRAGFLPVRAAWLTLRSPQRVKPPQSKIGPEVQKIGRPFMASVLAGNPLALLAFIALLVVLMAREHERPKPAFEQAATKLPASYRLTIAV